MTSVTLTSELEAINIMLAACDEAPVASLVLSGLYPLDNAKAILSETARVVQAMGWKFNTEEDYPLTRDGGGLIALSQSFLRVDVNDDQGVDPVQRGARLYDIKAHSFVFTLNLKATVVICLPWDDLPEPARQYIAIKAARTMQGRSSVSESTYRYSQEDEQAARLVLADHEATTGDYNMLRDSASVASVVFGREMW